MVQARGLLAHFVHSFIRDGYNGDDKGACEVVVKEEEDEEGGACRRGAHVRPSCTSAVSACRFLYKNHKSYFM